MTERSVPMRVEAARTALGEHALADLLLRAQEAVTGRGSALRLVLLASSTRSSALEDSLKTGNANLHRVSPDSSPDSQRETVSDADLVLWSMPALRLFSVDFLPAVETARSAGTPVWCVVSGLARAREPATIRAAAAAEAERWPVGKLRVFFDETIEDALSWDDMLSQLEREGSSLSTAGSARAWQALLRDARGKVDTAATEAARRLERGEAAEEEWSSCLGRLEALCRASTEGSFQGLRRSWRSLASASEVLQEGVAGAVDDPVNASRVELGRKVARAWSEEHVESVGKATAEALQHRLQSWQADASAEGEAVARRMGFKQAPLIRPNDSKKLAEQLESAIQAAAGDWTVGLEAAVFGDELLQLLDARLSAREESSCAPEAEGEEAERGASPGGGEENAPEAPVTAAGGSEQDTTQKDGSQPDRSAGDEDGKLRTLTDKLRAAADPLTRGKVLASVVGHLADRAVPVLSAQLLAAVRRAHDQLVVNASEILRAAGKATSNGIEARVDATGHELEALAAARDALSG